MLLASEASTPTIAGALVNVAAVIGAVLTIGGVAWWLLKPRISDWLESVAADASFARQQLDPSHNGSAAAAVAQTRDVAADILPGLIARLNAVEDELEPLPSIVTALREQRGQLNRLDEELLDHRRRLGNLEESVITGRKVIHE